MKLYPEGLVQHSAEWKFSGNVTLLVCGCGWDSLWTTPDVATKRWRKHINKLSQASKSEDQR